MDTRIAIATTRAGSSSTYWATCLAWTLAETRRVLLIDLDMAGGTIADLLQLDDRDESGNDRGRSIGNLIGGAGRPITVIDLENQAIPVPSRPYLRVIPGIPGMYGPPVSVYLKAMQKTLSLMRDEIVICDLGQALSYPGLSTPIQEAEQITNTFDRFFIVVRDDPALMSRTAQVLRIAKPAFAELVICQQRHRQMKGAMEAFLAKHTGDLRVRATWPWDEKKATAMGDTGRPMTIKSVAKELEI